MAKKPRRKREPQKYRLWVKVIIDDESKTLTYHSSNLLSFVRFLDIYWKGWKFFNVYLIKTDEKVGQFTQKDRPSSKWIKDPVAK